MSSIPGRFLLAGLLMLATGWALEKATGSRNLEHVAANTEQAFQKAEKALILLVDKAIPLTRSTNFTDSLYTLFKDSKNDFDAFGLGLLVFENKHLVAWSDNAFAFNEALIRPSQNGQLIHLKNGWYKALIKTENQKDIVGLLLVKHDYAYQNKFLENNFNPYLNLPEGALINSPGPSSFKIHGINGDLLFSVSLPNTFVNLDWSIDLIYLAAALLLLVGIHFLNKRWIQKNTPAFLALTASVLILRLVSIYAEVPEKLYALNLFNPQHYASSFLSRSLGDLLINSFIGCYYATIVYRHVSFKKQLSQGASRIQSTIGAGLLAAFFLIAFIHSVISGLILNSQIPFNINNVFELNLYSCCSFIVMVMLFILVYVFVKGLVRFSLVYELQLLALLRLLLFVQGLFLVCMWALSFVGIFQEYSISTFVFSSLLILSLWYIEKNPKQHFSLSRQLFVLFLFSLFTARVIYVCNATREQENRKALAVRLEKEQDPVAEYLFRDIEQAVQDDEALAGLFIGHPNAQEVASRMQEFYFNGYWSKYDCKIYCFDRNGRALPKSLYTDTIDYFEGLIHHQATPTQSKGFYFLNNDSRISYLAKISVHSDGRFVGTIFVEINSKFIQDYSGFPELLLSENVASENSLKEYSYAQYIDHRLLARYGYFNYLINSIDYEPLQNEMEFRNSEGFSHLFYKPAAGKIIVVSRKADSWLDYLTLFSYLFTFFCICGLVIWVFNNGRLRVFNMSFSTRIQVAIFLVVIVSLLVIGGGTVYYIYNKYNARQFEQMSERIGNLSDAVQKALNVHHQTARIGMNDALHRDLTDIAKNVDFNLFDPEGKRIFSSQSKIIDQGILSERINYDAFVALSTKKKLQYIHSENIGKLHFSAAYVPLLHEQRSITGYLNLPYFSKQTELRKEISSFLVTLINVYIFLLSFSIVIALIISGYISKPLKLVQEKLAVIKLGRKNELIEWSTNDEIGQLVAEYNRMVNALAQNAELLAQSEREGAWKEMAKQVAHEIKNPLTPMKLSLQHLQRAWKDQSPERDKILERVSQTLIQQIDALSAIATAFSSFAQMPKANTETLDLALILKDTITLFKAEETNIVLETNVDEAKVLGDKDQLLRAFTNIIKNALQAIPEDKEAQIKITLHENEQAYIVAIADNGSGIPAEFHDKVFTPSFTTKTSGMGLGLAMTKKNIEYAGGAIRFESRPGEGTTFFVTLPKITPA